MVKLQAGSIYSSVEVQDNTGKGFRSAQSNMKSFQQSAQELQERIFPLQNALKGGMFVGAGMMGVGLLTENFTTLNQSVQALSGNFSSLGGVLNKFRTNCSESKKSIDEVKESTAQAGVSILQMGENVMVSCGSLYSLVEGATRGYLTIKTLYSDIRGGISFFQNQIAMYRDYATVCSTAEAATELLTAAGFRNISVTQAQAAQTLLMTNVDAGRVVIKKIKTACSWASIKALVAETAAKISLRRATQQATAWTTALSIATMKQSAISAVTAVKNFAVTVSLGALGVAAKIAAVGVAILSAAFWVCPLVWIAAAVVAAGAALMWLCGCFGSSTKATEENSKVTTQNTEALRENSEAMQKKNEVADECDKTDELRLKRLEQLAAKEHKSAEELREMKNHTDALNKSCSELALTFDETTGSVDGLSASTHEVLKDKNLQDRIQRLREELKALKKEAAHSDTSSERKEEIATRQEKIERQLAVYEMGYTDNVMGLSEAEWIQKKIDIDAKAQQEIEANRQRLQDETMKRRLDEYQKANDVISSLEQEVERNKQNALENELATLREQTEERKKALQSIIDAKRESGESYAEEAKTLERLRTIEAERAAQIEEKHANHAKKFSDDFEASEAERAEKEKVEKEKKAYDALAKSNPIKAMQTFQTKWEEAEAEASARQKNVRETIAKAQEDGIVTQEEEATIAAARKEYDQWRADSSYFHGKLESVRDSIGQEALALQKEISQPTAPIESFSKSTVEAFKKERELDGMSQSPETKKLADIQKLLEEKYTREAKVAEETRDFTEQLVNNIMGV
ncbi:MAG: hypothetical protein Q4D38_11630 [Planctomycetia bacterium]|nr:hypothetical protein [Planctomycetia bacterium]